MYVFGSGREVLWVSEVTGLGLGFTNSGGTWGKWDVSVLWLRWCGWCWGRVDGRLVPGSGRVVLCLCVCCILC